MTKILELIDNFPDIIKDWGCGIICLKQSCFYNKIIILLLDIVVMNCINQAADIEIVNISAIFVESSILLLTTSISILIEFAVFLFLEFFKIFLLL